MNWTLQELCLRRIIEQFEIYTFFSTSKDVKLKHMFDFLLRRYSEEIMSELYDRRQLKPMFVDILMNKYLTSINTAWFQTDSQEIISAKMAVIGSTLKKLHLHRSTGRFPWCYLPNLETISFNPNGCCDDVLEYVAKFCPNVVEIHGGHACKATIIGIKHLGIKEDGSISCPKLKRLSIGISFIDFEGVEYVLENFPYLEDIGLVHLPFVLFKRHETDVLETRKIVSYNFTCMQITQDYPYSMKYNNILKTCFSVCPHLKELQCQIRTEEHLDTLSNLKNLTKLDLKCALPPNMLCISGKIPLNVNGLMKCIGSTLKSLTLTWCVVSLPLLAESCPLLEELRTECVNFQIDTKSSVRVFHSLSSCIFYLPDCDDIDLQGACALLSASYRLRNVVFHRCDFTPEEETKLLKAFRHCPLKSVEFCDCIIEFDFAEKILTSCPNLSVLKLRNSFEEDPELRRDLNAVALALPLKPFILFDDYSDFGDKR